MVSKDSILQVLGKELDMFTTSYENQIALLRRENQSLLKKTKELEQENKVLQTQLLHSSHSQGDIHNDAFFQRVIPQIINGISYELIDEWILSSGEMESYLLLLSLKNTIHNQNYEMSRYIIDCFTHNQVPLLYESKQTDDMFREILSMIFLNDNQESNSQFDELFMSTIDLLQLLKQSTKKKISIQFIKEHLTVLTENILDLNEPLIITNFLRVCFIYRLTDELHEILTYMLKIEWGFLDGNISKDEITFLLWYSYLFNLDQQFLEKEVPSVKLFQKSKDLSLYYYLYDCLKKEVSHSKSTFELKKQELQSSRLLIDMEIEEVVSKVERELKSLAPKQKQSPLYDNKLRVVNDEYFETVIKQLGLEERLVAIPLYRSINDNFASDYTQVMIMMSKVGTTAYLSEEDLKKIKTNYYPLKPKIKEYLIPGIKQTAPPAETKKTDEFEWPNTNIEKITHAENLDDTKLNEYSALKLMGYQITGLTRDKRWSILKNAVPTLGLKKVATIIAYNVKLRKGQKNGKNKFQYAITEWEHDLSKLKKTYYKKDFNWPHT